MEEVQVKDLVAAIKSTRYENYNLHLCVSCIIMFILGTWAM